MRCWELNPGPLEKQVLLTAEFSLQPLFLVCLFVLLVFLFSFFKISEHRYVHPTQFTCGSQRTALGMALSYQSSGSCHNRFYLPLACFCSFKILLANKTGLPKKACHKRQELSTIRAPTPGVHKHVPGSRKALLVP